MTNFEKIKQMDMEEMSLYIAYQLMCDIQPMTRIKQNGSVLYMSIDNDDVYGWLESEAKE